MQFTFLGKEAGAKMAKADYVDPVELSHLLAALMPENRLAMEISMVTGLRISDVLGLRTEPLKASPNGRMTVRELKTGKNRRIYIPKELRERALRYAGRLYIFEHRYSPDRHRTRQAVWKDMKRVARAFNLRANLAPHSARKTYSVAEYQKGGLKRLQGLLQHTSEAVTVLYALADEMTRRKLKGARSSAIRP